jgi:hypothetical protein
MIHIALLLQVAGGLGNLHTTFDVNGDAVINPMGVFNQNEQTVASRVAMHCLSLVRDSAREMASAGATGQAVLAGCRVWKRPGTVETGSPAFKGPLRDRYDAVLIWLEALTREPRDTLALKFLSEGARVLAKSEQGMSHLITPERREKVNGLLARVEVQLRLSPYATGGSYRACTSIAFALGDHAAAHDCAIRALRAGLDSTWQAIRLGWLARTRSDESSASRWVALAIAASRTQAERAEVGWHLQADNPLDIKDRNLLLADSVSRRKTLAKWLPAATLKREWLALPDSALTSWLAKQYVAPRPNAEWHTLEAVVSRHLPRIAPLGGIFLYCDTLPCYPAPPEPRVERFRLWNAANTETCLFVVRPEQPSAVGGAGLRQWDAAQRNVTEVARALQKVSDATVATTAPCTAQHGSWSISYGAVGQRPIREYAEGSDAAAPGALGLSDIVFGVEDVSMSPTGIDRPMPIPLAGPIARGGALRFYYQIRSTLPRTKTATEWSLTALTKEGEPKGAPTVVITQAAAIEEGVTAIDRVLDIAKLKKGSYRMVVSVRDVSTGESATTERVIRVG